MWLPLGEFFWVCFVVNRSPFGTEEENPFKGEPTLIEKGKEPREAVVSESEKTRNE